MSGGLSDLFVSLLLTPFTALVFLALLAAAVVPMIRRGRTMTAAWRAGSGIAIAVCLIYFAFIIWMAVMAGSNGSPPALPQPQSCIADRKYL